MFKYQKPRRKDINDKILLKFALKLNASFKQTFVCMKLYRQNNLKTVFY